MTAPGDGPVTLLLSGDVMLGRGIDQVLAHPGDPTLTEPCVHDARRYVELCEEVSGPVPRCAGDDYPWGDALAELTGSGAHVRVLNLETSITTAGTAAAGKTVHYRMNPANLGALRAARPDVCVLANNHVLDYGADGLRDTLETLASAKVAVAGAGHDVAEAWTPAHARVDEDRRVVVLAWGHPSAGVARAWAAGPHEPGVALLPDLSDATTVAVAGRVRAEKTRGSIVVVSLHWGTNWGWTVPAEQVRFAHRLVDAGADVVHGHSSHHPRPLEVYAGRLILYGCGDLVNDYEGIRGFERYRDELRLLYRVTVATDGSLVAAELSPYRSRRLRLERADPIDARWLAAALDRWSHARGVRVRRTSQNRLALEVA